MPLLCLLCKELSHLTSGKVAKLIRKEAELVICTLVAVAAAAAAAGAGASIGVVGALPMVDAVCVVGT